MLRTCIATALLVLAPLALAVDGAPLSAISLRADVLPGSGHSWGTGALDAGGRLFIARRENGLTLFDPARHRVLANVAGTEGANAVVVVTALDRIFVANMDGTLGIIRRSDLRPLRRVQIDAGNLNNLVFDRASGKLIITGGRRQQRSAIYQFDPVSERVTATREFEARKFDAPLALADGSIIVPLRDEGRVMRIAAATLAPLPGWEGRSFAGCQHPSAVAADEPGNRLFVACRGKAPQVSVARLDDGSMVTTLPATPAINALAWDPTRRLLLVPSGNAASLTLVQRQDTGGDEAYRPLADIGTRPWAHNMVFDAARGRAYLFAVDVIQPAPDASGQKQDPRFLADSFTVLEVNLGQARGR
ncbi:YncE family protein [Herbaspirillum sp. alder98]|uniref:YncE family protein n=1 Tax=Herbaspirillum sp. alder98 TaxID=2913096 RepID=UPI001CD8F65F|nr:hypothetical protein [Herbaspirillum sp. alder98]MCA1323873.1 hypothetical protein [Herbaspirillum sp. alder98]